MKEYKVTTKSGVVRVKADNVSVGEDGKIIYFWENGKIIAGFNVAEIVGFVQAENIA
jgi:hypothetical protein